MRLSRNEAARRRRGEMHSDLSGYQHMLETHFSFYGLSEHLPIFCESQHLAFHGRMTC